VPAWACILRSVISPPAARRWVRGNQCGTTGRMPALALRGPLGGVRSAACSRCVRHTRRDREAPALGPRSTALPTPRTSHRSQGQPRRSDAVRPLPRPARWRPSAALTPATNLADVRSSSRGRHDDAPGRPATGRRQGARERPPGRALPMRLPASPGPRGEGGEAGIGEGDHAAELVLMIQIVATHSCDVTGAHECFAAAGLFPV
jgi:hypothetical protein